MDSDKHDLGAWRYVSPAAKQLVRGLLTVDPNKGHGQLLSPAVLSEQPTIAKRNLMQTFNAFHRVTREGGLPSSSGSATPSKLVISTKHLQQQHQRCHQPKPHAKTASSPTKQLVATPWTFFQQATKNSNNSSSSASSLSSVADSLCSGSDNSVLNYRTSSRIHDYLNSLSQIQQQAKLSPVSPCATSPSGSSSSSSQSVSPPSSHFSPFEAMSGVSYRLLPPSVSPTSSSSCSSSSSSSSSVGSPVAMGGNGNGSSSHHLHHQIHHPLSLHNLHRSPPHAHLPPPPAPTATSAAAGSGRHGPMTRSRKRKLKDGD